MVENQERRFQSGLDVALRGFTHLSHLPTKARISKAGKKTTGSLFLSGWPHDSGVQQVPYYSHDWRFVMMKKSKVVAYVGLALTIVFYLTIVVLPTEAEAKSEVVTIEGISYNVDASMSYNLKSLIGKKVSVTLDSGKTFAGFVKEVGNHFIHLEKLEGKDYFDALIRIENISAIDTRFRNIQR